MLSRRGQHFTSNDITDRTVYLNRRKWMAGAAALVLMPGETKAATPQGQALKATRNEALSLKETPTKFEAATTYNNFYEFGVNKEDPARLAGTLRPRPWAVQVDGLVHKPKTYDIDELLRLAPLEERVYSLRCVEAWSMIIPWIGFPLSALLKQVEPMGKAKFVEFVTLHDPEQFPGQALVCALYRCAGIRAVEIGSVMLGGADAPRGEGSHPPMELVRLAIPRRVYTQSHIDYVIEVLRKLAHRRHEIKGLRLVEGSEVLTHFTAKLAPAA